jgi:uncharacterized protein YndB with AHSA1/START domain
MEYASIEREVFVDASPDVVFDVVSRPEHIAEWWSDEAEIHSVGEHGHVVFRQPAPQSDNIVPLMVVELDKPRRFSFRWDYAPGVNPAEDNSLLVTFDLRPSGAGTVVTMTETGFREQGWEAAVLEAKYLDHVSGWDYFVPRIGEYTAGLLASS